MGRMNMKIKISKNFVIQIPKFTDYYEDLVKLYNLNFGMFKFSNEDYELLSRKIVFSDNNNWDKAIALVVLHKNLLGKQIFSKEKSSKYPYYKYPFIHCQERITFIVEALATKVVKGLMKALKEDDTIHISTYIWNATAYSFSLEKDYLLGTKSEISGISNLKKKQQKYNQWRYALVEYKKKYPDIPKTEFIKRLKYLDKRIKQLKNIRKDSEAEIKFYQDKIHCLEKIQKEADGNHFSTESELRKKYQVILTADYDSIKDVLKDSYLQDYIELKAMLRKDLKEMSDERKLTESLQSLTNESKLLHRIVDTLNIENFKKVPYVFMEELDLLDPREITKVIDRRGYIERNPLIFEEYLDLREKTKVILSTLQKDEEEMIKLRWFQSSKKANRPNMVEGTKRSYAEIGIIFGLSGARIREKIAKGIRKLGHPARSDMLREYYYNSDSFAEQLEEIYDEHNQLPANWK